MTVHRALLRHAIFYYNIVSRRVFVSLFNCCIFNVGLCSASLDLKTESGDVSNRSVLSDLKHIKKLSLCATSVCVWTGPDIAGP